MTLERRLVDAGTIWGPAVGYSRAVRVGRTIHVAGTTGLAADGTPAPGGMYGQSKQALANILAARTNNRVSALGFGKGTTASLLYCRSVALKRLVITKTCTASQTDCCERSFSAARVM